MNLNIQIGSIELVILSLIFLTLLGIVIFLLIKLNKRIEDVGKPRFGFLGKTLTYSVVAVTIGIGAVILVGTNLANLDNGDNRTNADNKYSVDFQSYIVQSSEKDKIKLELSGVVMEDNFVWGTNTYDLTWTFQGMNNTITPIVETMRGSSMPSFIVVSLPRDLYSITLKAQNSTTLVSKTKEIDLR